MNEHKLLKLALVLAFITIFYNLVEGIVSVSFGISDETLSLLGFGVDSFVEVISGIGIAHMIFRMRKHKVSRRDEFERLALRITGISFFLLALGIIAGAVINIIQNNQPETTVPGIIISSLSILTMYFLMRKKLSVGRKLNSDAIIADANCTKSCFYLSFILLFASGLYEWLKIPYIDIAGGIGVAIFAFKEGKEAFEKAKSKTLSCSCNSC